MDIKVIEKKATAIRQDIIRMLAEAGNGHTAGALGMADIFAALYFGVLRKEDRLFLSCGHIVPVRYAAMAQAGIITRKELKTLRKLGSRLQGHPDRRFLSELLTTSGPLGSGLAQAAGWALGLSLDGKNTKTFCITSDGEHDEGNHWEAVMFAAKYRLAGLIQVVDRNGIQISGFTKDIMPLEPLEEKYRSFKWHPIVVDGNDIPMVLEAFEEARLVQQKPVVIIANTVPGKGVSFMENDPAWHGKVPNEVQTKKALEELANA